MSFYYYRQNNTGGSFQGPAITVIIEAGDCDEANQIALSHDIYFDGCESGIDCSCCGDRWHPAWGAGNPEPMIYGKPVSEGLEPESGFEEECAKRAGANLLIVRRA